MLEGPCGERTSLATSSMMNISITGGVGYDGMHILHAWFLLINIAPIFWHAERHAFFTFTTVHTLNHVRYIPPAGSSIVNAAVNCAAVVADNPNAMTGVYWLQYPGMSAPAQLTCVIEVCCILVFLWSPSTLQTVASCAALCWSLSCVSVGVLRWIPSIFLEIVSRVLFAWSLIQPYKLTNGRTEVCVSLLSVDFTVGNRSLLWISYYLCHTWRCAAQGSTINDVGGDGSTATYAAVSCQRLFSLMTPSTYVPLTFVSIRFASVHTVQSLQEIVCGHVALSCEKVFILCTS